MGKAEDKRRAAARAIQRFQVEMKRPESERPFVITCEWIHSCSKNGSWNSVQLGTLGIKWPARTGWIQGLEGKRITVQTAAAFAGKEIGELWKRNEIQPAKSVEKPKREIPVRQSDGPNVTCPYCGQPAVWVPNETVYGKRLGKSYMIWNCIPCDARVGCHENSKRPLGTLANKELRQARIIAHGVLDPLFKSGKMTRPDLYRKLSEHFGREVHVGESNLEECQAVIDLGREWAKVTLPPKNSLGSFDCSHLYDPDREYPEMQPWDGLTAPWLDQDTGELDAEFRAIIG